MTKFVRCFMLALFAMVIISSLFVTGCTRYAKEEQLVQLDETESSALAAEARVAELEKEKADLEKKLAEKQDELKQVQEEKEMVQAKLQ